MNQLDFWISLIGMAVFSIIVQFQSVASHDKTRKHITDTCHPTEKPIK